MTGISDWLASLAPARGLTPSQRRIAAAVGATPRLTSFQELPEVAVRVGVDPSTVVRYAQALGFPGWTAFQQELRAMYLASLTLEETRIAHHVTASSLTGQAIMNDIRNLQRAVETIDPHVVEEVVDTLSLARQVLVLATGSSVAPATVLAHLGTTMGLPFRLATQGSSTLAATTAHLGPGDVLVVVCLWRPQREIVLAMDAARDGGAAVVALCDLGTGPVARRADLTLVVPSEGVTFVQSVTAATSVVYGLIAELEARNPERSRRALERTQRAWGLMDIYLDPRDDPRPLPHAKESTHDRS